MCVCACVRVWEMTTTKCVRHVGQTVLPLGLCTMRCRSTKPSDPPPPHTHTHTAAVRGPSSGCLARHTVHAPRSQPPCPPKHTRPRTRPHTRPHTRLHTPAHRPQKPTPPAHSRPRPLDPPFERHTAAVEPWARRAAAWHARQHVLRGRESGWVGAREGSEYTAAGVRAAGYSRGQSRGQGWCGICHAP